MWGNALIIDRVVSPPAEYEVQSKEEDTLVLPWEQRRWARGRFTTTRGRKIGIALPTGSVLSPGAIVWIEPDWYLRIVGAAENVIKIFPSSHEQALRIAFEVGNLHYPLALGENKLIVPDEKAMIRLMDKLGARWKKTQAVFDPITNTQSHLHG
jgi:urease accessory protein UreE